MTAFKRISQAMYSWLSPRKNQKHFPIGATSKNVINKVCYLSGEGGTKQTKEKVKFYCIFSLSLFALKQC